MEVLGGGIMISSAYMIEIDDYYIFLEPYSD